jgi:hypothetical protein
MNNTTPPPPAFPAPAPKPKRNRTNAIIIGTGAAVIAAIITTGIVVVQTRDDTKPAATTSSNTAAGEDTATTTAAEEPDPEPTYAELDADDFTIRLHTSRRQCFGSAGCNVTVEPRLTYEGGEFLDPDAVYEITYEIRGDESGPVIATAELSDETRLNYQPSLITTASASTKVSVQITGVTTRGY